MTTICVYGASDDLFEVETIEGDGPTEEYQVSLDGQDCYVVEDERGRSLLVYVKFGRNGWELALANNYEAGEDGEHGYADDWAISFVRRHDASMPDPAIKITAPGRLTLVPQEDWRKDKAAVQQAAAEAERLLARSVEQAAARLAAAQAAAEAEKARAQAAAQARAQAAAQARSPRNGSVTPDVPYPLLGLAICITGSTGGTVFDGLSRGKMEELIRSYGGKTATSVTADVDILIQNRSNTVKAKRAKDLGVRVMTMDEFSAFFKIHP